MSKKINWKTIRIKDLAGMISEHLRKEGIDAVLVGGACVSIYSKNRYLSYDLDYVTFEDHQKIKKALEKLGFQEKQKHFRHPQCPFLIEFVTPPVAVGKEVIRQFKHLRTPHGTVKLLRNVDCVKDRLASYFYWDDKQALNQAVEVCKDQKIDFEEIQQWSIAEGFEEKYNHFLKLLKLRV